MQKCLSYYAGHRHKTKAYRHAYDCDDMSPAVVRNEAALLFQHPLMAAAVMSMEAVAAQQVKIDAHWVLKRAALLADFNISTFVVTDDVGNAVYDFSDATDDDWYCISEYTVDRVSKGYGDDRYEVERIKLKTHCKMQALQLVGKHTNVQAFREQLEITGAVGVAQLSTEEFKQARLDMLKDDDC